MIDGHNDLPWAIRESEDAPRDVPAYDLRRPTPGHTDLARLRAGRVGGQFWSVYIPGDIKAAGLRPGAARADRHRAPGDRPLSRGAWPSRPPPWRPRRAMQRGQDRLASSGMEGGHAIENSLGALRAFYDLGVRYMTLTHNVTLDWADAANDDREARRPHRRSAKRWCAR